MNIDMPFLSTGKSEKEIKMKKRFFNLLPVLLVTFASVLGATSVTAQNGNVAAFRYNPTEANNCSTTFMYENGFTQTINSIVINHPLTNAKPNATLGLTSVIGGSTANGSQLTFAGASASFIYLRDEDDIVSLFKFSFSGNPPEITLVSNNCPTRRWIIFWVDPFYVGKRFNLTVASP